MQTQKGTLPTGVEFENKLHKEFELRRELLGDAVVAMDNPRCEQNKYYATLCIYARRMVRLGDIPKDKITPELLMEMPQEDFAVITDAAACFRPAAK
jgi:hypothetical protein